MSRFLFHFNKQHLRDSKCPAWIIKDLADLTNQINAEPDNEVREKLIRIQRNYNSALIKGNLMGMEINHYFLHQIKSEVPFLTLVDAHPAAAQLNNYPVGSLFFEGDLTIVEEAGQQVGYVKPSECDWIVGPNGMVQQFKPVKFGW